MLVTNAIRNSASSGAPGNCRYKNRDNACIIYLIKCKIKMYKNILRSLLLFIQVSRAMDQLELALHCLQQQLHQPFQSL